MQFDLQSDLSRFERMAFVRAADCRDVIKRFHALPPATAKHPDCQLLEKVYGWVLTPLTLWPVDVRGLCLYLLDCAETGRDVENETRLLVSFLPQPPRDDVCQPVGEYEHSVKEGNYERLIHAQYKFDLMERDLSENAEFRTDWRRIAARFPVAQYRNRKGVIRRRMVQERNFRPRDWQFSRATEKDRFQNVFDAFCYRWNLYGMESDRPLLLKLTVNLTAFGTMIEIPKYWSFDPKRDLNWREISRLHRARGISKQGHKLTLDRKARENEARKAKYLWAEAARAGLRGEKKYEWVMAKLGWDPRTDPSRLRKLVRTIRRARN